MDRRHTNRLKRSDELNQKSGSKSTSALTKPGKSFFRTFNWPNSSENAASAQNIIYTDTKPLPASPPDGSLRLQKGSFRAEVYGTSKSPTDSKVTCSMQHEEENRSLQARIQKLEINNRESTESPRGVQKSTQTYESQLMQLEQDKECLEAAYQELEARANRYQLENLKLRSQPEKGNEEAIRKAYINLWYEIEMVCNSMSQEKSAFSKDFSHEGCEELVRQIPYLAKKYTLSPSDLRANASGFAQAYLSQVMVNRVLPSSKDSEFVKDLWAPKSSAESLDKMERDLSGLEVEDFNKWRCTTVRYLIQSCREADSTRVNYLLEETVPLLWALFGLGDKLSKNSSDGQKYRTRSAYQKFLKTIKELIQQSVALSKLIRSQRSEFEVVLHERGLTKHSSFDSDNKLEIRGTKFRHRGNISLVVRPALIRRTDEDGLRLQDAVFIDSKTWDFKI